MGAFLVGILLALLLLAIVIYIFISYKLEKERLKRENELRKLQQTARKDKNSQQKKIAQSSRPEKESKGFLVSAGSLLFSIFFIVLGIIGIWLTYQQLFIEKIPYDFGDRNQSYVIFSPLVLIVGILRLFANFTKKDV